jgi:hypothetical protein
MTSLVELAFALLMELTMLSLSALRDEIFSESDRASRRSSVTLNQQAAVTEGFSVLALAADGARSAQAKFFRNLLKSDSTIEEFPASHLGV